MPDLDDLISFLDASPSPFHAPDSAAQRLRVDKVLPKPFTRAELLSAVLETIALSK